MPPLLEVVGVSKTFGGVAANVDISFDVMKGEILGLIGPNGAGKTSLFNAISGEIVPDTGEIRLEGQRDQPDFSKVEPKPALQERVDRRDHRLDEVVQEMRHPEPGEDRKMRVLRRRSADRGCRCRGIHGPIPSRAPHSAWRPARPAVNCAAQQPIPASVVVSLRQNKNGGSPWPDWHARSTGIWTPAPGGRHCARHAMPGSGWGPATVISDGSGDIQSAAAIAIGSDGAAIAAWRRVVGEGESFQSQVVARKFLPGVGWGSVQVLSTSGISPSLAISPDGRAHIVFK